MKIGGLFFIIAFLFLLPIGAADIRMNEIELNPYDNCNDCSEWIEFYSDNNNQVNLSEYFIKDASNKTQNLSGSFSEYYVIDNLKISLNNKNEKLYLYDKSNSLIQESPILSDSYNDNRSWQYCEGEWLFETSTKNKENYCEAQEVAVEETNGNDNSEQQNNNQEVIKNENDVNILATINNQNSSINMTNSANYIYQEEDVIILKSTDQISSEENRIVYKSKNEYIKEYAPYVFLTSGAVFILLFLINKIKDKENVRKRRKD